MGIRRARLRGIARAFRRPRRCRFSRGAMEGVGVGRGWKDKCRSKQSGWRSFVRQRKKSAVIVVLEKDGKKARWHKESEVLVI